MSLTVQQAEALYKLYPQVTNTVGDEAFDTNGNLVQYDLNAVIAQAKKDECVANCKTLLTQSDWSVLPDVGLKNQADYITYRGILRGYVIQPVENPDYPTLPTPVWE